MYKKYHVYPIFLRLVQHSSAETYLYDNMREPSLFAPFLQQNNAYLTSSTSFHHYLLTFWWKEVVLNQKIGVIIFLNDLYLHFDSKISSWKFTSFLCFCPKFPCLKSHSPTKCGILKLKDAKLSLTSFNYTFITFYLKKNIKFDKLCTLMEFCIECCRVIPLPSFRYRMHICLMRHN